MSHYFHLILLSTWSVGNDCSKQVLQIYINRRGKRKFNPRKYGFHIMNHGIARVMDLSIGLHVTSKSGGGGGGGSQKSFPSYSLFCGPFQISDPILDA